VEERLAWARAGSDPRNHPKRTAVERTSVSVRTHHPSRGVAGPRDLCGGAPLVRAGQTTRCGQHAREVPPLVALLARRTRCAVPVRGGDSPVETSARTFTRVGPVHAGHASSEACVARLVSPCHPREGADEGEGAERVVTSHAERGCEAARGECPCIALFAEVGRTPSGSEKRVTGGDWVESPFGTRSA